MNKKIFIIAILLLGASSLFGQKVYLDGYIIMDQGDTIFGKIAVLSAPASCKRIKFTNSDGIKVKFTKTEVKAYKRGDEYYYRKVRKYVAGEGATIDYLKLLATGKINLYGYMWNDNNGGVSTTYYVEKDGIMTRVLQTGFKKHMAEYFSDNPALEEQIRNKELNYWSMERIVEIYNLEASTE